MFSVVKNKLNYLKDTRRALSLIELMLAVAILTLGILGIIYSYLSFTSLVITARNISSAERVASAKLEEIRGASIDHLKQEYEYPKIFSPKAGDPFPGDIKYQDLDYRGIIYIDEVPTVENLLEVTVIICWRQGGRIIGESWVFEEDADPSSYSRPVSPVTLTTYITAR